jgi:hypothetical protein
MADVRTQYLVGPSPRFLGQLHSGSTVARSEHSLIRHLWIVFAMIGDYQSMIILLPHPPNLEFVAGSTADSTQIGQDANGSRCSTKRLAPLRRKLG